MDEVINYQDQEELEDDRVDQSSSEWQMEHVSFLAREDSKVLLQYKNYHLHFIRKKEPLRYRRMIPSKKIERLAFYRNYASSPNKAMRMWFQVKGFIWLYLVSVFFKTIPHTYINVFMASYVPEQHLYLVQMSPCFHGAKFVFIMAALFELIYFSKNIVLLLDYILRGILFKNPWNRCSLKLPETEHINYTCYTITEVFGKTFNKKVTTEFIDGMNFYNVEGERFMLVQVEYLYKRCFHMPQLTDRFFFFVLWVIAALTAHYIFKRCFWKLLNITHTILMILFLLTYIHTSMAYIQTYDEMKENNITVTEFTPGVLYSDVDSLLEVTVAPPLIHILTARSVQEIFPTRDSVMIVISNTLFYLFRGLLYQRLQRYCELLINSPLSTDLNYLAWYFMWPIYLHSFFLGDVFTVFYFVINFIVEFTTFMVAFQCLVEFMAAEWMYFNRVFLTLVTAVCGTLFYSAFPLAMEYVCLFAKLTVNIVECIVINFMYPLPRLLDDMTFHYGIPPTKMRVITFRLIVFVAIFIFWTCISCLTDDASNVHRGLEGEYFALFIMPLTLVLGFFYAVAQYLIEKKVDFRNMFVPADTWGPNDYNLRQLRKQYDSRFYIGSQAPRNLSRYLMAKGETECYRLDVSYDTDRRSTIATTDYRRENEKKTL